MLVSIIGHPVSYFAAAARTSAPSSVAGSGVGDHPGVSVGSAAGTAVWLAAIVAVAGASVGPAEGAPTPSARPQPVPVPVCAPAGEFCFGQSTVKPLPVRVIVGQVGCQPLAGPDRDVTRNAIPPMTATAMSSDVPKCAMPTMIETAAMIDSTIVTPRGVDDWPRPASASTGEALSPSAGIRIMPRMYSSTPRPPSNVSTGSSTRHRTGSVFVARPSAAQTPAKNRPWFGRTRPKRVA